MTVRNDYTVVVNKQTNRSDLWDVVVGRESVHTANSKERAQWIADQLNADPWFFDRGQTRFERNGAVPSVERKD